VSEDVFEYFWIHEEKGITHESRPFEEPFQFVNFHDVGKMP
jgi:hypothetical protein